MVDKSKHAFFSTGKFPLIKRKVVDKQLNRKVESGAKEQH